MAIIRINELPSGSGNLTPDDLVVFMDDPSGSAITKKISITQLGEVFGANTLGSNIYVSPSGNNSTANGSINRPFGSIQAAHDYALNNFNYYTTVVINIAPHDGVYDQDNACYIENLNLTRKRTILRGLGGDQRNKAVQIRGNITINVPSTTPTQPLNDIYGFEGLLLRSESSSSSPVLTIAGSTNGYSVAISNCFIWTESSNAKVINVTNTTSSDAILRVINSRFQAVLSSEVVLDLSNIRADLLNSEVFAGTNSAIKSTTSTIALAECNITGAGTNLIDIVSQKQSYVQGNVGISIDNTRLSNTAANGTGLKLASSTRALVSNAIMVILPGTGNVVSGPSGSQLLYKNISGYAGFNSSISSGINTVALPYVGNNGVATLTTVPASGTATGLAGQVAYDSSYLYVCTATNTWRRASISSW